MKILSLVIPFMVFLIVSATQAGAQGQIKQTQIGDSFHVLDGRGGFGSNVGVLAHGSGLLIVDSMMAKSTEELKAALRGVSSKAVTHIINTHAHSDHTGGNAVFADTGALLLAPASGAAMGTAEGVADASKYSLIVGGVQVEIYPVLSHSEDDVLVYFPAQNVLFMGDTYTTNWHPTFYAGGAIGQLAAVDKALSLADAETLVVPGHGSVSNRQGLLVYREAFQAWVARLGGLLAEGKHGNALYKDRGLREIVQRFLIGTTHEPLPEGAYRRFIERSIAAELALN
ncbi:MBL fold metallo-hydrolase [Kordiimonas sp.]|uniref:MBL fold metallo-hydrolase n=1 Tax=Kordiimonas sp. TaxID=1970157 RepID=UPI003A902729